MQRRPLDSGPASPVSVASSDAPVAPVAVSFPSDPPPCLAAPARRTGWASTTRRLAGWAIDLAGIAAWLVLQLVVPARFAVRRSPSETVLVTPGPWLGAAAGPALAWSWIFGALWGRTPGIDRKST